MESGGGAAGGETFESPIPIGAVVEDKYQVRRVLGCGSMGVVYVAYDIALEREVAIKVLLPHYARQPRIAERFRREAVAMASVRDEHVVQIFAFGDHEGNPYFVMEYVPGQTVAKLVDAATERDELLYFDVVLGVLGQICRGLQAVHDLGIVHRDVKLANMLIGPRFRVALTDFGLVEAVKSGFSKRDLAGTPLYIAPELIQNRAIPEEQRHLADIYALGISTYEMLTGYMPFDGESIKEILHRHVHDEPPNVTARRSDVPIGVDAVIARALHKDPSARHATATEFLEAMNELRSSGPSSAEIGGRRILIVDDDPEIRTIYATALKVGVPGAMVLTAADGLSAVELVRSTRPDLVLLDLDMPGMNGLEVCAFLRGDELTARIPLMILSAHVGKGTPEVLHRMGVEEVLQKSTGLTTIVELARRHLQIDTP